MSSPGYSPHQQTRQQLDELDALLQRMLSIPVGAETAASQGNSAIPEAMKSDEFAPLPPSLPGARVFPQPATVPTDGSAPVIHAWRVEVPASAAPSVPLAQPVEVEPARPPVSPPHYPVPASHGPAVSPPMTPAPYPYSMVFGPPVMQAPPEPVAAPPAPTPIPPPTNYASPAPQWHVPRSSEPAPLPFLLLPLAVVNGVFDLLTFFLGPLGTLLRRPAGRNALGWLGILMILGAIGWGIADWYGIDWTK